MIARTSPYVLRTPFCAAQRMSMRPGVVTTVGRFGMRNASTAVPHLRPRPNRVLMGVAVGSMLLGAFAYQYYKANALENVATARVPVLPTPPPTRLVSYDELQKHNTNESCWLLINGHVYDTTSVLRWHPAGPEPILENAGGHDASQAFLAVHKLELLSHLPPTARIGPIDHATLPAELVEDEDEEEVFRTGMA